MTNILKSIDARNERHQNYDSLQQFSYGKFINILVIINSIFMFENKTRCLKKF